MRLSYCALIAPSAALVTLWCGSTRGPTKTTGTNLVIYPVRSDGNDHHEVAAFPGTTIEREYPTQNGKQMVFLVHVDREGILYIKDRSVTEDQFLDLAKNALKESEDTVAILFVESGIVQGIHLSAQLSRLGYRHVQVFYPTATNR